MNWHSQNKLFVRKPSNLLVAAAVIFAAALSFGCKKKLFSSLSDESGSRTETNVLTIRGIHDEDIGVVAHHRLDHLGLQLQIGGHRNVTVDAKLGQPSDVLIVSDGSLKSKTYRDTLKAGLTELVDDNLNKNLDLRLGFARIDMIDESGSLHAPCTDDKDCWLSPTETPEKWWSYLAEQSTLQPNSTTDSFAALPLVFSWLHQTARPNAQRVVIFLTGTFGGQKANKKCSVADLGEDLHKFFQNNRTPLGWRFLFTAPDYNYQQSCGGYKHPYEQTLRLWQQMRTSNGSTLTNLKGSWISGGWFPSATRWARLFRENLSLGDPERKELSSCVAEKAIVRVGSAEFPLEISDAQRAEDENSLTWHRLERHLDLSSSMIDGEVIVDRCCREVQELSLKPMERGSCLAQYKQKTKFQLKLK